LAGLRVSAAAEDAGGLEAEAAGAVAPCARSGARSLHADSSSAAPRLITPGRIRAEDGRIGRLLSETAAHAAVIFREPS